jgi:hypothetical protein
VGVNQFIQDQAVQLRKPCQLLIIGILIGLDRINPVNGFLDRHVIASSKTQEGAGANPYPLLVVR